ncbi:MAG: DUF4080 domain-containing protein [Lachnospiraceae bacterium]|nr:DUF4080 domain-containing protein [Lachnospiraceae bacterium]
MKIILAALNAKYVHSNLAVYNLEAYTKQQFYQDSFWGKQQNGDDMVFSDTKGLPEIVVREYTINHNLDMILQSIYQEKAAVAAFSCYIWNIHEILTIAKELHKVLPDIHIWLGGPEVSYDSLKLLEANTFVEGIMQGEGEAAFYDLVKVWHMMDNKHNYYSENVTDAAGQQGDGISIDLYRNVSGIVYRDGYNRLHQNHVRKQMLLDEIPFIYYDLSRFQNKILYYETSRGCPFSCSYCLSSIDRQVRFRSMELVKKELQFFLDNGVPQVKLIDRTFNCNKEHSLAIWRYILEHDNGVTNFHFEVAADLIGEEELAIFRQMRPGLIQLEIGLQSTNDQTIWEIRRVMNIDKLKKTMLAIRGFGNIHQHLDLIAGLPYEDFITFKESFNRAYEMKPNQLQLGFLKVLKGSYMEEQTEQYELKHQDFQPYEVLSTKWISYDEILGLKKVEEMVEVYYNSDQFEHVLSYLIPFFESAYAFYEALGKYYEDRQLYGIGFKREARYEILRGFCEEWFYKCDKSSMEQKRFSFDILDDLLIYDYYLRENAKSRPSWAKTEPIEKGIYQTFFKNGGTEEISLHREGYDSKVAARAMHIESVSFETVKWLSRNGENISKQQVKENNGKMYCLFDYGNRNPLSKDAKVIVLSHL